MALSIGKHGLAKQIIRREEKLVEARDHITV